MSGLSKTIELEGRITMSIHSRLTVAPDHDATPSLEPSLVEEVRGLRNLAKDRRAASFVLFCNSTKHPALPRTNALPHGRQRLAA
jgi:hypothetical protein